MVEPSHSFKQALEMKAKGIIFLEGIINGAIIESLLPPGFYFSLQPTARDAHDSDIDADYGVRIHLKGQFPSDTSERLLTAHEMGVIARVTGEYDPSRKGDKYFGTLTVKAIEFTDRCE